MLYLLGVVLQVEYYEYVGYYGFVKQMCVGDVFVCVWMEEIEVVVMCFDVVGNYYGILFGCWFQLFDYFSVVLGSLQDYEYLIFEVCYEVVNNYLQVDGKFEYCNCFVVGY